MKNKKEHLHRKYDDEVLEKYKKRVLDAIMHNCCPRCDKDMRKELNIK